MNPTLLIAALLGLTGVAAAAYANHAIAPENVNTVMLAVRSQQIHALVLLVAGLALHTGIPAPLKRKLKIAATLFVLGMLLFSGNIYLHYFANITAGKFLVPYGGMTIMAGWIVLVWAGLRHKPFAE